MKTIKELTQIRLTAASDRHYQLIGSKIVEASSLYEEVLKINTSELFDFCYANNGKLELGLKIGIYLEHLHFAVLVNSKLNLKLFEDVTLYEQEKLKQLLELEDYILNEIKNYENN